MPIRVLLADDHAVLRDGLRSLLESEVDIAVVGDAANGRLAVQQAQQLAPDVVVMDIAMPELNGIDAARQIREVSPSTRVVILSMYSTAEHIRHALQAGAQGYLLKESAGTEVVDAVRAVHAGRRYLSQKIIETMIGDYALHGPASPIEDPLARLSAREREILQLVAEGKTSAQIAKILHLSSHSIATYRSRLMRKLGVGDVAGLVKFAIQHGLTPE